MRVFKVHTVAPFFVMSVAAVLVFITAFCFKQWGPKILINETRSEPIGVYRLIRHGQVTDYRRGMYVVFPVPLQLQAVVYGRGWLKNGVPFLKELMGVPGDQICIFSDRLEINHHRMGPVFAEDTQHQALPRHLGCFTVQAGDFFAASGYFDKSFDGRYFGPLPLSVLDGEARPLWIF